MTLCALRHRWPQGWHSRPGDSLLWEKPPGCSALGVSVQLVCFLFDGCGSFSLLHFAESPCLASGPVSHQWSVPPYISLLLICLHRASSTWPLSASCCPRGPQLSLHSIKAVHPSCSPCLSSSCTPTSATQGVAPPHPRPAALSAWNTPSPLSAWQILLISRIVAKCRLSRGTCPTQQAGPSSDSVTQALPVTPWSVL